MEDFLSLLNEPQQQGVLETEGPCILIAGAGSGKTRVLTYRIAHLIRERRADPFEIIALTFTNKAAQEMRRRIEQVIGQQAQYIMMGTFHSVFARILRAEAHYLGFPKNFTIYDTDDSRTLLKLIIQELSLDDKVYKPNWVHSRISAAKNSLITYEEYLQNPEVMSADAAARTPELGNIYRRYVMRCIGASAMDFDDLLVNTYKLFAENLDVLNKYQHRIRYVLVDEFQDTNHCQYAIVKSLAAMRRNICVVGDDAQSIYGFRGADITNILNFKRDYPEAKLIKLEQNYRSTKVIVEAANSVIQKNKDQIPKTVWTDNAEGAPIELLRAASDNEEGRIVASAIFEEKMQFQYNFKDFVVLYRTNSQSRAIEEGLRKNNIKYKIVGGLSFYQRKEIKDLLAYFRYALNQQDEVSFYRIINYPKRGMGDSSIDKLSVAATEHGVTLWEILQQPAPFVGARAAAAIEDFVNKTKKNIYSTQQKNAYEAASEIAKSSGILRELYEDKTVEGMSHFENVQELLNAVKEFVETPDREDKSLTAFLEEISLLTGQDQDKDDDQDKVTLMTVHMAKGLEFKNVFIVGLENDLFPSRNSISSRQDLEEERRLFYVAITRAQKKLFLSYALSRYRYGTLQHGEPSPFIKDIASGLIKQNTKFSGFVVAPEPTSNYARSFVKSVRNTQMHAAPVAKPPPADFVPSDNALLQAGMRVQHPSFGIGEVKTIESFSNNRKAKILFENFGEKTLLLSFAKLKIIEN